MECWKQNYTAFLFSFFLNWPARRRLITDTHWKLFFIFFQLISLYTHFSSSKYSCPTFFSLQHLTLFRQQQYKIFETFFKFLSTKCSKIECKTTLKAIWMRKKKRNQAKKYANKLRSIFFCHFNEISNY